MKQVAFKTVADLESAITEYIDYALDETYEELLDELLQIINDVVYDSYDPLWYERTYDLLERKNWGMRKNKAWGKTYRSLYFKDNCLTEPQSYERDNANSFTHGNNFFGELNGDAFLSIINDGSSGNLFNMTKVGARPFWDDFLDYCDRNFDSIFIRNCEALGIPIVNHAIRIR